MTKNESLKSFLFDLPHTNPVKQQTIAATDNPTNNKINALAIDLLHNITKRKTLTSIIRDRLRL